MGRIVDQAVLQGFVEEARGYLPAVVEGIAALAADPTGRQVMEQPHRHMHTIKGSASLLGLSVLSHAAYQVEEVLDDLRLGKIAMTREAGEHLFRCVERIADDLDRIAGEQPEDPALAEAVSGICRQVRTAEGRAGAIPAPESSPGPALAEDETLTSPAEEREAVPQELMDVFCLEAEDHLREMSSQLAALEREPAKAEALEALRRTVHTMKGAAGAVGLQQISQLAHRMEDLLDRLSEGNLAAEPGLVDLLFESADVLGELTQGKDRRSSDRQRLEELYKTYAVLLAVPEPPARGLPPKAAAGTAPLAMPVPPATRPEPEAVQPAPAMTRRSGGVVRVPLDRLDDLVRLVSELVINRSGLEQRMTEFEREVEELQLSTERLRRVSSSIETKYEVTAMAGRPSLAGVAVGGSRVGPWEAPFGGDFDELEFDRYTEFHQLSRELIETASDIRTVWSGLSALAGEFDGALNRQGRVSSEIQDKLMRTRMVPLSTLSTRLHRTVRVLARELGKQVDFVLEGESIELDKTVLEEMADPIVHLLRNAVDHGIESPEERKRAGKPERGEIRLRAYHEGNRVVIQVGDDGAGMDAGALRAAAVRGGYVAESEVERRSVDELQALAFLPGFTTSTHVSQVSGRGVGLDVVRTNIRRLKGSVGLESTPGRGTLFTIRLPMTLAVMQALLVKARGETFAVPLGSVNAILRIDSSQISHVGNAPVVQLDDQVYPLIRLAEVLSLQGPEDEAPPRSPVLILDVGARKVALAVDQLLGGSEVVIKTLGTHLRRVEGISGATLMGDGSVVLILNPVELAGGRFSQAAHADRDPARPAQPAQPLTVLVVDDSISVRRVVSNLIRNAGWTPVAAKDGLEALEIIQQSASLPDAVLVDIEMPRMDGYELMATLKAHPTYRRIPLLVLTSRAGEKHRQKAFSVGASDYIVKPYQEARVLDSIRGLAAQSRRPVAA